jgi:hypothetical protein
MEEKTRLILIYSLSILFVVLLILGIFYPAMQKIENAKPSKDVSMNNSKSSFSLEEFFDFSAYESLNLGEVCVDLEDCISVCLEDIDKCEQYCEGHSENELCQKVNSFISSEFVQDYAATNNISIENLPDELPETMPFP